MGLNFKRMVAKLSGYAYSVVFDVGGMDGKAFVNIAFTAIIPLNPICDGVSKYRKM